MPTPALNVTACAAPIKHSMRMQAMSCETSRTSARACEMLAATRSGAQNCPPGRPVPRDMATARVLALAKSRAQDAGESDPGESDPGEPPGLHARNALRSSEVMGSGVVPISMTLWSCCEGEKGRTKMRGS